MTLFKNVAVIVICMLTASAVGTGFVIRYVEARETNQVLNSTGPEQACISRWERSTLKSQFTPKGGCVVQIKEGVWVPDNTIRFDQ